MYNEEPQRSYRALLVDLLCLSACLGYVLNLKRKAEDAFIQQIFIATRAWQTAWGESLSPLPPCIAVSLVLTTLLLSRALQLLLCQKAQQWESSILRIPPSSCTLPTTQGSPQRAALSRVCQEAADLKDIHPKSQL